LALILLLYLGLAVAYSLVVPIGRGADEWAHFWYAQFIAEQGRLPANPAERATAGYKSDWPPLYHLLVAGVTASIDTAGPPAFKYRAANIRRQLAPAQGPDAILHTEDERFPWRQEILVWRLGRFLSIAFSGGTLLVTYFAAAELFARVAGGQGRGGNRLALLAVMVLAFNSRFLFTGMLFNYDSLTLLLSSLFLWLSIRIVIGYRAGWHFLALGALAGLALVSKYLAAPLGLIIILLPLTHGFTTWKAPSLRRLSRPLAQALVVFSLLVSPWFSYLLRQFNEIERYGPLLGSLAPLLRGDGSDRTVEALFAWLSGGQAPPPAYIETQSYTFWQILSELPLTFWGNPLSRPYPLTWFVIGLTGLAGLALLGLGRAWATARPADLTRPLLRLLGLYCLLPVPFMIVRLFGARDALEAVQGRHILFLAGPAIALLLVWGLVRIATDLAARYQRWPPRLVLISLPPLMLSGALGQLIFMGQTYPPPLPVWTAPPPSASTSPPPAPFSLDNGLTLLGYALSENRERLLAVDFYWQAGPRPAPEDYRLELALVDPAGQSRAGWLGYQTQARYPTRAWEAGDTVADTAWLPLPELPPGRYDIRWRLLGQAGPVGPWQTLTTYSAAAARPAAAASGWLLWTNGTRATRPPLLREGETALFTRPQPQSDPADLALIGPDQVKRPALAGGPTWANFIIGPDWPPGDYRLASDPAGLARLRVAANGRNFTRPEIWQPVEANFAGQIALLGYNLPDRRVEPGQGLPITLFWQGLEWMGEDFVIFSRLLHNPSGSGGRPGDQVWGGYDRLARENYSTLLWAPGEIVIDGFAVPVDPAAPAGVYMLSLGWYRRVKGAAESLPLLDPAGQPTGSTAVTIGPLKVGGPPAGVTVAQAAPQLELGAHFGEAIQLRGVDLTGQVLPGAGTLALTFYWQTSRPAGKDYTLFIHLRNATGQIVAQQDGPPLAGRYPTSLWEPGEIIRDQVQFPWNGLAPGRYELVVGWYDLASGERLPVAGSPDGALRLQVFEVESE
jgi:4-amino-4-deoxy-L-arabinose transferase-like glycosyltransferase